MTASRQSWIGTALALAIIAAWLALHVYGVFFLDLRSMAHLPQALLLTAIVIGFGLFAFALALTIRAYRSFGHLEVDRMRSAEPAEDRR